jgi:hypothetical protein
LETINTLRVFEPWDNGDFQDVLDGLRTVAVSCSSRAL